MPTHGVQEFGATHRAEFLAAIGEPTFNWKPVTEGMCGYNITR